MGRESFKLNDSVQVKLYDANGRLKSTHKKETTVSKALDFFLSLLEAGNG